MTIESDKSRKRGAPDVDWSDFDALSDEDLIEAAQLDPDNPPMTEEQLARMKPVASVKRLRWRLKLSREEFSTRYRIPLEALSGWENHTSELDPIAIAYLTAIAADPDGVARALQADARTAAE